MKKEKEDLQIKDVWPQLKHALSWIMKKQIEGAVNLLHMVICKRRKEQELEKIEVENKEKFTEDQKGACEEDHRQASYFQKTGGVQTSTKEMTDVKKNMLEIKVIENPTSTERS